MQTLNGNWKLLLEPERIAKATDKIALLLAYSRDNDKAAFDTLGELPSG